MGAWGMKTFECDTAFDWYDDFCKSDQSIKQLRNAFNRVLLNTDYLDLDDCVAVLAAGEVIAAAQGFPADEFPNGAYHDDEFAVPTIQLEQLQSELTEAMKKKACTAIEKVKNDADSEIRELFEETDSFEEWLKAVDDLIERIKK